MCLYEMSGSRAVRNKVSQEDYTSKEKAPIKCSHLVSITRARGPADQESQVGHERGSRGYALRWNSSPKDYDWILNFSSYKT